MPMRPDGCRNYFADQASLGGAIFNCLRLGSYSENVRLRLCFQSIFVFICVLQGMIGRDFKGVRGSEGYRGGDKAQWGTQILQGDRSADEAMTQRTL